MNELKEDMAVVNNGIKRLQESSKSFKVILCDVCFGMCGASDITGYHGQFNQTANVARNDFTRRFLHVDDKPTAVKLLKHTKRLLTAK